MSLQDEAKYLVFDGDVDAVWVENMNSVMDDNKLLTLPNGERIRLQPHCRLLFEVTLLQLLCFGLMTPGCSGRNHCSHSALANNYCWQQQHNATLMLL